MNDTLLAAALEVFKNMAETLWSIDSKLDGIHRATLAGLNDQQWNVLRRALSDQMNEIQVEKFLSELDRLPTTTQED